MTPALIYSGICEHAQHTPLAVALQQGKHKLTYQQLWLTIEQTALALSARLIPQKTSVLLAGFPPLEQLIALLSVNRAGCAAIVCEAASLALLQTQLQPTLPDLYLLSPDHPLPAASALTRLPNVQPDWLFLGALSSGSTGTPKLIWRDHQSWTAAFPAQTTVFGLSSTDRLFLTDSLVYTANLNACLHLLSLGGTTVFADSPQPRTWLATLKTEQISAIFMVPANYRLLGKAAKDTTFPAIVSAVSAGAKLTTADIQLLPQLFPTAAITEYYGASELGHVSAARIEQLAAKPASVGQAFPGVTIFIEDDVIWVASPYLAPAFRPKATVGDLGELDNEAFLYLKGRQQTLINSGGVKIIPEEVEAILQQCPDISEAAIVGIEDVIRGHKVCALIVRSTVSLTAAEVLQFCRQQLRHSHCPQRIVFVEQLPRTATGKLERQKLYDLLNDR